MASLPSAGALEGRWEGELEVSPGVSFPLVFRVITKEDGTQTCLMDSPSQKTYGIPARASMNGDEVTFAVSGVGSYKGKVESGGILGAWQQAGASYELKLSPKEALADEQSAIRPQYPKDPLPYPTHEVTFPGAAAGVTLAGTLSVPDDDHKATVVLLAGSGPQLRDQVVGGHHTFRVLSDHMTKKGIAVLRYDKRGVGDSQGSYDGATVLDFAADAACAGRFLLANEGSLLPNTSAPFGFVGHSEGGLTGPLAALELPGQTDFVGLLASMAMKGIDLQSRQSAAISLASGVPAGFQDLMENQLNRPIFEIIAEGGDKEEATRKIRDIAQSFVQSLPDPFTEMFPKEQVEPFVNGMRELINPWFQHFFGYDPLPALEQLRSLQPGMPVLAVNGSKDLQVLPENLEIMAKLFEASDTFTRKEFEGMNHLFQTCQTGLHTEYSELDESFSPVAMDYISDWILGRSKRN